MNTDLHKRLKEAAKEYADENYEVDYSAGVTPYSVGLDEGDEMTPSRTIFARELDYVHQYQQLLRLCGLNDLADNFRIE